MVEVVLEYLGGLFLLAVVITTLVLVKRHDDEKLKKR